MMFSDQLFNAVFVNLVNPLVFTLYAAHAVELFCLFLSIKLYHSITMFMFQTIVVYHLENVEE